MDRGLIMTIRSLPWQHRTAAMAEVVTSHEIRALIAEHLGVDVERVTDEAHFADDLGADWLDRLELMIAVEDQFAEVEITDEEADRISVVGDLIRHVESVAGETTMAMPAYRRKAALPMHKARAPRRSRPAWKTASSTTAVSG
jgi:acyl carrier protein